LNQELSWLADMDNGYSVESGVPLTGTKSTFLGLSPPCRRQAEVQSLPNFPQTEKEELESFATRRQ
jgi:hypothetical protein